MKFEKNRLLLYGVTDRAWTGRQTLYDQVEAALQGGVTMVQLREKDLDETRFLEEAIELKKLCAKYRVPFIINDNLDIALQCDADGIHVGLEDMSVKEIRKRAGEEFIIGATAKTVEQAKKAEAEGADYLGVGAVFPSPTKTNAKRITKTELSEICASVQIPAVAIGGINKDNASEIAGGGMAGIAVVSGIFGAENITEATKELRKVAEEIVEQDVTKSPMTSKSPKVLTIAGSDCSGGAGIQADLKTMLANGVYGMSVITALTAQNTMGVSAISEVTPTFLRQQLKAVLEDIFPDAVKIGMVPSAALMDVVAEELTRYNVANIVLDPVMIATSGSRLMDEKAVKTLKETLLPLATLVTPNIPEAEVLSGMNIQSEEDMVAAAKTISDAYECAVLCKGGHRVNDANDLLYDHGEMIWFYGARIENPNTHGTGCTLSSAIASNLANGLSLEMAVQDAKSYIEGALAAMLDLGNGSGPLDHGYAIQKGK
nr:bifunctional hydroxymethylpyrimidine kinase/phosphomethylpyrimidine kinase [Eubacterium sp.]